MDQMNKSLQYKAENILNAAIGDVITEIRARMEKKIALLPENMKSYLESRNMEKMPLLDYLTIGVHRKGALDKNLTDARKFIGVPKAFVRKMQEI